MTFDEVLGQVLDLLQREGRVSYRALKRRFALDDDYLEDLKVEIMQAKRLALDEDGVVLVWVGATPTAAAARREAMPPAAPPVDTTARPEPPGPSHDRPEAERRQLTVLFCDLVDSTVLAGRLDPEEWRDVVQAYQASCAQVIQRFEGHIAQYLGDGLLVYFGYPRAHEDDAQRAIRTGLAIMDALRQLNTRLTRDAGIHLCVRVGIHTGLVVVGEMGGEGRQEQLALGEVPNIAARMQGLAAPDTVVISAATHRLVQGYFVCQSLGPHPLKGMARPVEVYRVVEESEAQSRLEIVSARGPTLLVGRASEVALLLQRWAQVKEGIGQVVLLSGEAGIGKSRLVQAVKALVAGEPHVWWECRCSPYYQHSALYPIIDLLQRVLQFQRDESPAAKLGKLEAVLADDHVPLPDVVPLFAALLSLPPPDRYPPLTLTPQRQRQKTLEAVVGTLLAMAVRQPVLFIIEDLHWADPSTLEVLGLVMDQTPTARLLIVLTCRPEFHPPWAMRAHLTHLSLSRLPCPQVEVMVERVAGGKTLPAEVIQQVVAKTDGVPLFIEELTRMVLESDLLQEREDAYELMGPLPALAIPATLHDSLMARLDRLAPVKAVAQLGATLGRTFSYELLQAVSPLDDAALQPALARLVEAELLYQRGKPPLATYAFKHALVQEEAHQSLLKSTRQYHHQRIAQVLEERFPETVATEPELLAHHYTEAGLLAQAIPYWQQAAQQALQRSANVEAIQHLTTGLTLLKTLPDTPERAQQELVIQASLGPVLIATKGYAAPDVEQAYSRAYALCQHVQETPQRFPVLRGLWSFYLARGEVQTAYELGQQLLHLAQRQNDPALLLEAYEATGLTLFYFGELTRARAYLERSMALYDPQQHRTHVFLYGRDPGTFSLSYLAMALCLLGYPDQALQRSAEAVTLAQTRAHPYSLTLVLTYTAVIHQFRRESQAVSEQAEASMTLAIEQGFPYWAARGPILRGWALAAQGQRAQGLAYMQQGLAAWRATGAGLLRSYWSALLAEVYGHVGQPEVGLDLLAETLPLTDQVGERCWAAELYRLKGELLLQAVADARQAEACFHLALDVARRQQARAWELRAAMSLSRLWQQQGKGEEARDLLSPLYGWFTEGFETVDLQEAKALLEELA
jgi:TOMM system kinase/cyclase fusion protein